MPDIKYASLLLCGAITACTRRVCLYCIKILQHSNLTKYITVSSIFMFKQIVLTVWVKFVSMVKL